MKKLLTINEASKLSHLGRIKGKKIGLIVGCFDIMHFGHIQLFRYARKYVDILIIGLDNDSSITLSKGRRRPIHNFKMRSSVLSEIGIIDHIVKVPGKVKFGSQKSSNIYENMEKKIKPDFLISHKTADSFWRQKVLRAKLIDAKCLVHNSIRKTTTTSILQKLNI